MTALKALVFGYLNAFSTGRPEAVASHVAEAFRNRHLGALGTGCDGKATYQERLKGFLGSFQDLRYDVLDYIETGDRAAVRYRMHFRQGGRDFQVPGMMWFVIENGRIAERTDCWDSLVYLKQSGMDAGAVAKLVEGLEI